ncbi:basic secretory family protein [Longimycelium tulufanense]|uniref:basic secretory family protein n=1 Tax=Longimycelium tulufanense TaxID=907463 RepID=UPI001E28B0F3|nr:basic secretory family protein [Longimycelium tulufanense]
MPDVTRYRGWLVAAVATAVTVGLVAVSLPGSEGPTPQSAESPLVAAGRPSPPASTTEPTTLADRAADPTTDAPADPRAAAVRDLLDRRARALLAHDEEGFLSTVDPQSSTFRTTQRSLFRNLENLNFDDWAYQVDPVDVVPPPALGASVPAADELWAPRVELRYALTGGDTTPTTRSLGYLFARRGHQWYLTSDTALEPRGRRTWRGPWDFGPCLSTRTARGLVVAHPSNQAMAVKVARELDAATHAVSEVWGTNWPQRVVVLLPETPGELQALVGPNFAVDGIAAVAVADRVDPVAGHVEGARVVLNPRTAAHLSTTALRVVLRHEITHVAARGATVDGAPMWILEGFADYVGYRNSGLTAVQAAPELARLVQTQGPPASLPDNSEFSLSGKRLDIAYQMSWSLASYVAERGGQDALVRLYRRIAAAGPGQPSLVDDALREALGIDRQGLLAGWQEYLRATFR